jgi:dATP/dGTP diphosphohydrolase
LNRIDSKHIYNQRAWSEKTFGPGLRTGGILDHIRKELREIEADPLDLSEWVDVIILAFDGAWRTGAQPQDIIDAIKEKQMKNERREWPDWTTFSDKEAIEHIR